MKHTIALFLCLCSSASAEWRAVFPPSLAQNCNAAVNFADCFKGEQLFELNLSGKALAGCMALQGLPTLIFDGGQQGKEQVVFKAENVGGLTRLNVYVVSFDRSDWFQSNGQLMKDKPVLSIPWPELSGWRYLRYELFQTDGKAGISIWTTERGGRSGQAVLNSRSIHDERLFFLRSLRVKDALTVSPLWINEVQFYSENPPQLLP